MVDLIQRFIDQPAFDEAPNIPLYLGWNKLSANLHQTLNGQPPVWGVLTNEAKQALLKGMSWASVRHDFTSYDYVWETGLKDSSRAKKELHELFST